MRLKYPMCLRCSNILTEPECISVPCTSQQGQTQNTCFIPVSTDNPIIDCRSPAVEMQNQSVAKCLLTSFRYDPHRLIEGDACPSALTCIRYLLTSMHSFTAELGRGWPHLDFMNPFGKPFEGTKSPENFPKWLQNIWCVVYSIPLCSMSYMSGVASSVSSNKH